MLQHTANTAYWTSWFTGTEILVWYILRILWFIAIRPISTYGTNVTKRRPFKFLAVDEFNSLWRENAHLIHLTRINSLKMPVAHFESIQYCLESVVTQRPETKCKSGHQLPVCKRHLEQDYTVKWQQLLAGWGLLLTDWTITALTEQNVG